MRFHRLLFVIAVTFLTTVQSGSAAPSTWNIGFGQGNFELYYGGLGDHEIVVGCDPQKNTVSLSISLVAPVAERRAARDGVVTASLAGRRLRIAARVTDRNVDVMVPRSSHLNGNGQELVSTRSDPARVMHSIYLDNDRRAEIDAFTALLATKPGEPLLFRIEGDSRVYRVGADLRVRSAREIRRICPPHRRVS